MQHVPGLIKVVVRNNFVGVVAEKQWQAAQAAKDLKVTWKPGPGLPAQKDFYDYMRKQAVTRCDARQFERCGRQAEDRLRARFESHVFVSLSGARFDWFIVRGGRCAGGSRDDLVADAVGVSDAARDFDADRFAGSRACA